MKIIYLHQYFKFPDEIGGTRSFDLSLSFLKKGYEVEVITATSDIKYKNKKRWTSIYRYGIKVHYTYLQYGNHLSYFQRSLIFFKFLWISSIKLLQLNGDIVIATSTPLTIGIPALIKRFFHKTPYIFEVRDVWPEAVIAIGAVRNKFLKKMLFKLEELIYNSASFIVPLSIDMRNSIISRYPQNYLKTNTVIENISEISRFQDNNLIIEFDKLLGFNPRFTILYAGTFGRVNSVHKFVDLAEYTINLDPTIVYILVGDGFEKFKIKELATEKNLLGKNLFIFDPIPKSDLPKWYKSVSMGSSFVIDIPELWANSANKFFDTLAASRPILINHEGWQAVTIRENNIGYVLPTEISRNAAIDFVKYTHDNELHEVQRKNALNIAKEKFSLDVATKKYLSLLSKFGNNKN